MSTLKHYYGLNHLRYVTTSTYRRARLFDSKRFKDRWVATLGQLRRELKFRIVGHVLMPEHFHALLWPTEDANPSQIMQRLKDCMVLFILKNLRQNLNYLWCQKMLARATLPSSVHHHSHFRVWQRKFYDMSIWTPKKRNEKLNYMHNNPVKRGSGLAFACHSPLATRHFFGWPWSSWRFYFLNDTSLLAMDRML